MTDWFSEDDVIGCIERLTRPRLLRFIEVDYVRPGGDADAGYVFRRIDIARLELLCDLSEDLGLDETALGVVLSLIDQLHRTRQDLAALASAIETLPAEVRADILATLKSA